MGHAETTGKRRSLSSPSLFRRFSMTSSRAKLALSEPVREEDESAGFLPLIRVVSPLDLFPELPQQGRPKHERSTSWSERVAIFAGNERTRAISDDRRPKFTLESSSDLDLSRPQAMSSPAASSSSLTTAPPRPHLVRRDASSNPSRRYTFAMAMTDEHISDEVLVKELERIRAVKAWTGNSGGDLEEFWDLGGGSSQSHSPFDSTSEGSARGFFETAPCDSPLPAEQLLDPESDTYMMGIALTKPSPQHERRMPCRSSLPAFPVYHRLSNGSNTSPTGSSSGPSTSNPHLDRTSMLDTSDASWHTARRALLTCRECVRTERHYLTGMRALVSQETSSPPPLLMVQYAEHLVETSERLLARMEENPNIWGVTTAFLGETDALEEGFVEWCGKVGAWFEGRSVDEDVKGKGRQAQEKEKTLVHKTSKGKLAESTPAARRSLSSWKKDRPLPELPTSASTSSSSSSSSSSTSCSSTATSTATTPATSVASSTPSIKLVVPSSSSTTAPSSFGSSLLSRKKDKEAIKMTSAGSTSESVGVARQDSSSSSASSNGGNGAATTTRKPAVRDLAILPTQRVMRYVLLFKDLLAHTPSTSPARALVERAVEAATRIADKCDHAQNHAAFSLIPPPPPPKDTPFSLPRTWSRHKSFSKSRDTLPLSRRAASEHGHASTTDVTTVGSVSVSPSRAPSSHGEKMGHNVLIKPKRNKSTGTLASFVPSFTPFNVAKLKEGEDELHTTEYVVIRSSNKLKKRTGAPPPSSFPVKAEALIMLP